MEWNGLAPGRRLPPTSKSWSYEVYVRFRQIFLESCRSPYGECAMEENNKD